jgi:AcrR family transcriptional regulator
MGGLPRRRNQESAARILDGAADEFAATGYTGARIQRIAKKTGFNVRMIYYHYGSKLGLYRAVLETIYEQMSAILESLPRTRRRRTVAALIRYVDLLTEQPRFAGVLVRELLDGAQHLKLLAQGRPELFRNIHHHARELVESGIAAGELRQSDPAMTVMSVTSIVCFILAVRHSHALLVGKGKEKLWKRHLLRLLLDGMRKRS